MKINVDKGLYIDFEGYNYTPHYYHESKEIPFGKYEGQMSKGGWKSANKHFRTLGDALKWCTEQDLLAGEDLSILEYVQIRENNFKELVKSVKRGGIYE